MPLTDAQKINFEVVIRGTLAAGGGEAQLTLTPLHYRRTNFSSAYSPTEFITAFHTAVKTNVKNSVSSAWNWDSTYVRCINSPTEATSIVTVDEAGAIIGDVQPGFVAQVLSKRTALRGRSYQGRLYLPGVPESATLANVVTAAQGLLLDTLATSLGGSFTTAAGLTYSPQVLSRLLSNMVADPSTIVATDIASVVKRTVLGRLFSRKSTVT